MPAPAPTIETVEENAASENSRPMTVAERKAAWAAHNRADLLENLKTTAAERFEWLERTWQELDDLGLLNSDQQRPPASPDQIS